MKRLLLLLTVVTAIFVFAFAAYAVDFDGGSINVTATVVPTCVVEVQDIAFGEYGGLEVLAQGALDITCINELNYQVGLDIGQNDDGFGRRMIGGPGQYLNYGIFKDNLLSDGWGDACVASPTFLTETCAGVFVSDGSTNSLTPWGQIPASQLSPVGSYSDVVSITIVY